MVGTWLALARHVISFGEPAQEHRQGGVDPASRSVTQARLARNFAGVGVKSILPARGGGDVVKIYLVKHRTEGSDVSTLAATLVVEQILELLESPVR